MERSGETRVEVDARGDVVRVIAERDAAAGGDVVLTIDAGLQQLIDFAPVRA